MCDVCFHLAGFEIMYDDRGLWFFFLGNYQAADYADGTLGYIDCEYNELSECV